MKLILSFLLSYFSTKAATHCFKIEIYKGGYTYFYWKKIQSETFSFALELLFSEYSEDVVILDYYIEEVE